MNVINYPLKDGTLTCAADFLAEDEADLCLRTLLDELDWRQDQIRLFGRQHRIPRLQCFQGEPGIQYTYSSLTLQAQPWHPSVFNLKTKIESLLGHPFNSVLMNLYRDGADSMGWHSDDETELGKNPAIASLSLGQQRRFLLRRKDNRQERVEFLLAHGSLILMAGPLQHFWQHSVPRTQKPCNSRINLTFRKVV